MITEATGDKDVADEGVKEFRRIEKLLERLPEEQATVVKMRFTDDLSFVEIAAILGLSDNTVKSRYRYAIAKLRKEYALMTFDDE